MKIRLAPYIALCVLILHLSLGIRGLWQQDKNIFTQHPFSDPFLHCVVLSPSIEALPLQMYRGLRNTEFSSRIYLELLPAFKEGLQRYSQNDVEIRCTSLNENPARHFPIL